MMTAFKGRCFLRFAAAAMVLAVALAASVCGVQAHPSMHATPAGHSRPNAAPDAHEECLSKAVLGSAPAVGQSTLPILAVFNVPDLPLIGTDNSLIHSFEEFRDPLVLFFPTHERAPPVSFLS